MNTSDMTNLGNLAQQAQELQKSLQSVQARFSSTEAEGEAGGGLVKVTINCQYKMNKIFIDPILLKEAKEVIEDVIIAAYNNAAHKVEELMRQEMFNLAKELKLPTELGGSSGNKD